MNYHTPWRGHLPYWLTALTIFAGLFFAGLTTRADQGNQLVNPGFETGTFANWTTYNEVVLQTTSDTYYNGGNGGSNVFPHSGLWCAKTYNSDFSAGSVNYNGVYQDVPTVEGSTFSANGWAFTSAEDLMGAPCSFWYEVEFLNSTNGLLALWQSPIATNAPTSFPDDLWQQLFVTNQYQVSNFAGTTTIIGNAGPSGIISAPTGTTKARFQAVFRAANNQGGSIYFDDTDLDLISGPAPPVLTLPTVNGAILATNTSFSFTAVSGSGTITNLSVTVTTNGYTGGSTNSAVYGNTSSKLTVTGLNTGSTTVSFPLQSNIIYKVVVTATDNNNLTASSTVSFDTVRPLLVIEAEDFNYNDGQFIDTPPDGGLALYQGLVGDPGPPPVDENKSPANNSTRSYYRPNDAVVIQGAAPDNGTEQKYLTAAADGDTTDVPLEVGYNGVGDWLNYTRTFTPGSYYIYARMATDGSGEASTLSLINGTATTSTQNPTVLGSFNFTDNDWNGFDYVPLVDQYGNLVSVNLGGVQTLRGTVVGNPNIDFYMLVPSVPVLTPSLRYVYPDGIHPFEPTNKFSFNLSAANGAGINSSGIDVVLNGVDVTSQVTLSGSTNSYTGSIALQSNMVYSVVINATNADGLSSSYPITFDTFTINNYQWEAVDYDFSTNDGSGNYIGGLYIDNPVPTCDITTYLVGELATNSYFDFPTGLSPAVDGFGAYAQQGVDINWPDSQGTTAQWYRPDGVGSQPASDYLRPKFVAARVEFNDPNIGVINIGYYNGGNWLNYTRDYPTNNYNIWGRLAGGAGPFSNTVVSVLTSGYGTANQTTNVLGAFSDPNAIGWQAWHWIPLEDTNGNIVVVPLGGKATLKVTSGNNLNTEFFMLVPATSQFLPPHLTASLVGGQVNLSILTQTGHTYTVLYSPSLTNPHWTQVGSTITGDGSSHTVSESTSGQQGYYEVSAQ